MIREIKTFEIDNQDDLIKLLSQLRFDGVGAIIKPSPKAFIVLDENPQQFPTEARIILHSFKIEEKDGKIIMQYLARSD